MAGRQQGKRVDNRPVEGIRFDALVLGGALSYGALHYLNQLPYIATFSWEKMPYVRENLVSAPMIACTLYVLMVHVVRPVLFPPPKKGEVAAASGALIMVLLKLWNLALAFLSLVMLMGMGMPMAKLAIEHRFGQEAFCDKALVRWNGPGFFWMYVFMMSKYIELVDTVFLVIRRKPVMFLHWYHHTTVLCYAWFAVVNRFTAGWYFAIVNAFVHTVMYWYYYRMACGYKLTYGKFITTIQLTQMLVGIAVTGSWTYFHLQNPASCPCDSPEIAIVAGSLMYGSYFFLFLQFYLNRYVRKPASKKTD